MNEISAEKFGKTTGLFCVYFTYRLSEHTIPQIILRGSKDQCYKHVDEYNRISPEKYRCSLMVAPYKEIYDRIEKLKKMIGTF